MNISKVYENTRKAHNRLTDICAAWGITPPDHVDITPGKHKLGRSAKERKGSPVYYASQTEGGNISIVFHTFKGGEYKETYSTAGEYIPSSTPIVRKPKKTGLEKIREDYRERQLLHIVRMHKTGTDIFDASVHNPYFLNSPCDVGTGSTGDNLQSIASNILGIRYNGDAIIIPLFNVHGIATGYQVIRDGGRDKKMYGTVKGSAVIIGDINQALSAEFSTNPIAQRNKLNVCEGVRTGLAIHASTGEPVICAMSASGLKTAIEPYLDYRVPIEPGKSYAGVGKNATNDLRINTFVIGADNDKTDDLGIEKPLYENAGLVFANKAAAALARGKVNVLVTAPRGDGDWYDVLRDNGILETAKEYRERMAFANFNYAYARRPSDDLEEGTRYLPPLELEPGVTLVKSPIGTGKTHALKDIAAKAQSFLYISHLQSLADYASKLLNLKLYSDKGVDVTNEPMLSICLNSLLRLSLGASVSPYEYVIADEIEQILRRMPTIENKGIILTTLEFLVTKSKHVVFLDAHIGKLTKAFLKRLGVEYKLIANNYKVGKGRTVKVYAGDQQGKKEILSAAVDTLNAGGGNAGGGNAGGRVFISCNNKKEAHAVYTHLAANTHKKGLYISSDNSGDQTVKAFFRNPNVESSKYDFIVSTPSTNTGVSIDSVGGKPAFDFVGYIAHNGINTHTDVIQGMGRVRDTKEIHLWIENGREAQPLNAYEIASPWYQAMNEAGMNYTVIDSDGNRVIELPPLQQRYMELVTDVTISRMQSHRNFKKNVLMQLLSEGYELENMQNMRINGVEPGAQKFLAELKEKEAKAYAKRIKEAQSISDYDRKELEKKHRKEMTETDAVTKKDMGDFYHVDMATLDDKEMDTLIERDRRGRYQRCVKNAELATYDVGYVDILTDGQRDKVETGDKMIAEMKPFQAKNEYFQLLLLVLLPSLLKAGTYSETSECVTSFMAMIAAINTDAVNIRLKPGASSIKFIGEQLRRIGIKQNSKKVMVNGERSREYSIDLDKLRFLVDTLKKRNPERVAMLDGIMGNIELEGGE